MLVLSRRKNESIVIGENIEITVIEIQGDLIKLGIDAPQEVSIYRKELWLDIKKANEEATQATAKLGDKLKMLKAYKADKKE
ncbi:MAG: carbon storage regulator CsrA [Syntrophomonadaceae bacterium]|nr:carbon storage regulator CsrA [Syntrophomonadaceae bacterium]